MMDKQQQLLQEQARSEPAAVQSGNQFNNSDVENGGVVVEDVDEVADEIEDNDDVDGEVNDNEQ